MSRLPTRPGSWMPGSVSGRMLESACPPIDTVRRAGPVRPSERIDSIDILRGIALAGVLAINLVTEFRVSIFEQFLSRPPAASPLDRAVETVLMLAVDMKAFALFSLLFGAGLAIQFDRLFASPSRTRLLLRRLIVLLAIGLVHLCLIWNGDILTEYALAGLIVLPLLFGPRWLLACGALASLGLYLALQEWPPTGLFPSLASIQRDVAEANRIYASGGFVDVLAFRLREIRLLLPLHVYVFPRTVGLFWLGRSGLALRPAPRPASGPADGDCRRRYGPRRSLDRPPRRRDDAASGARARRTARHHPAGAGLWRGHHRRRQS